MNKLECVKCHKPISIETYNFWGALPGVHKVMCGECMGNPIPLSEYQIIEEDNNGSE